MKNLKFKTALENYEWLDNFKKNKIDFLSEKLFIKKIINEETAENIWKIFNNIFYDFEKINNKDLSMFSKTDIERMFKSIPSSSMNTFKMYLSQLNNYEFWAIERGLDPTGDNPCTDLNIRDLVYINSKELKIKYIDWDFIFELRDKILKLKQGTEATDKVTEQNFLLLVLIRLGLKGRKWSEVLYLKESDIDFEKKIINVTNRCENTEKNNDPLKIIKSIKIEDDRILQIIKNSKEVTEYSFVTNIISNPKKTKHFVDYGYLVKSEENQPKILTSTILRNRLNAIFNSVSMYHIAPTHFFNSAKLESLLKIKKDSKYNKLSIDDFISVQKFYEPNSCYSSYISLKDLYVNTTKDNSFFKKTEKYNENGEKISFNR